MEIPDSIAAELSVLRQNVALSVIKSSAEADKAIASILEQSISVGPPARGANINLSA
jgi:hypothetical protein